ncbi:HNH endonuclease signature motif containing protein [Yersinia enterocolitica]|uniref:HNH endonuclease signature motif containing protein n=1 Tax=Yersinia enterocolitica TaxID=630 RepID=UPI00286650F9|nr:HNH endonuclease [Yersinia enterocolitica]HDV5954579.1 HNH endonuclease [Yersinia enterocolitica]HDV7154039.1 HNH endonuclease [Yersinia enterocolitica]HED5569209.1 HNH endonuclease [Yersinia enterocolitica]
MDITPEQARFFWSKVDVLSAKECWVWKGAKKPKGYGNLRVGSRYLLAHRVAWELSNFSIPEGYLVCHACDNPSCCNPSHLLLGNARANFTDMITKNRQEFAKNKAIGMRNVNAKLSWDQVCQIREMYGNGGETVKNIAIKHNVTPENIRSIINFKTRREA